MLSIPASPAAIYPVPALVQPVLRYWLCPVVCMGSALIWRDRITRPRAKPEATILTKRCTCTLYIEATCVTTFMFE